MRKPFSAFAFAVSCSVLVFDGALFAGEIAWDQSGRPAEYADGALAVVYDADGKVTELTADPGADGLTATGGDIEFASSANVRLLSDGCMTLSATARMAGGSVESPAELSVEPVLQYEDIGTAEVAQPSTEWTLLAENALLSALTNVYAALNVKGTVYQDAKVCFLSVDGETATCEVQRKMSATLLRSVKLAFKQEGDDVYVRNAGYGHINPGDCAEGEISVEKKDLSDNEMWTTDFWGDCYVVDLKACFSGEILRSLGRTAEADKPETTSSVLAGNALLSTVTNISASLNVKGTVYSDAKICFLTRTANTLTCEVQRKMSSTLLRSVKLELTQVENSVYVRNAGYGHINPGDCAEGEISVEENHSGGMWTTDFWKDCYVVDLRVFFSTVAAHARELEFAAANVMDNVKITVGSTGPAMLDVSHADALPRSGAVEIGSFGMMRLCLGETDAGMDGLDNGLPITVKAGGLLNYSDAGALSPTNSTIVLDGGLMAVAPHIGNYDRDMRHYVRNITFRNGARIYGCDLTLRERNVTWKVEGSSPSFLDSRVWCWARWVNEVLRFKLDVADVTGNADADFIVSKAFRLTDTSADDRYRAVGFTKQGEGTVYFAGPFVMTNRATRVEGGMIAFGASALSGANDFTLSGGGLSFASGENSVNLLSLEDDSRLVVEDGAVVSFASCAGSSWQTGKTLTVEGDLSKATVRFGDGAGGLSVRQRKQILCASNPSLVARLDAEGRLFFGDRLGLIVVVK